MIHSAAMEQQDLRKAGLKVTHPRMRILELLEQTRPRHMTAEDIYRQLLDHGDEIGLATVAPKPARVVLAALRVVLGFYFLWAFVDKLFGFGFHTARATGNLGSGSSGGTTSISLSTRR